MKRVHLLAAAGFAAFLPACDMVRLPGAGSPEPAAPAAVEAEAAETDIAPASAAEPIAGTIQAPEGETPTVDRDAPEPGTSDEAALADPASFAALGAAAARPSLALLNAAHCALPEGAAPTPTVGAVAGATELEEPMAGVEVVNALAAPLSAFPGIVKLEPRRTEATGAVASGHCSAVRIRATWFLTAAHCIDQPYDELRVIGDAANLRSPAARITAASSAICHGGYLGTDNAYSNDIALLRLSPEQASALAAVPVARTGATAKALAPANYPAGEMAGWGLTRYTGHLSNDLMMSALKITAVGPAAITVASHGGAGPCIGDSGGPLYVSEADGSKTVVGILSVVEQNRATGRFCDGEYNGRFTNLQGYTGWIDSVIAFCEAQPDACT
jgi:Trypsin